MAIGAYLGDALLKLVGNIKKIACQGGDTLNGVFGAAGYTSEAMTAGPIGYWEDIYFSFENATSRIANETRPASISAYLCIKY
jgi:hypothetical protein